MSNNTGDTYYIPTEKALKSYNDIFTREYLTPMPLTIEEHFKEINRLLKEREVEPDE